MQPKDRTKEVTFDDDAHGRLAIGVEIMRKAVGRTYGPGGRNVIIAKKYVHPILTRDGVTVARDIAGYGNKIADPIAREAAKLVYQASEKTNKTAGDGTTATVLLLAELYQEGRRRVTAGDDPMLVKKAMDRNRDMVLQFIESQSRECDEASLQQVASISCGDPELGAMISDLVWEVGVDGAITISYQNTPNIQVEKVTGYLFDNGFKFLTQQIELTMPMILVTQKRMATKADIVPVLELIAQQQRQFVIVGDVSGAALETLMWAVTNNKVDGVSIMPPAFGADGHEYFEDLTTYVGGRLILEGDSFDTIKLEDFGAVESARISREKAILFGMPDHAKEVAARVEAITEQLKTGELPPSLKEQLEQRRAKLAGKVSIIKVGAATEFEREELFFRVEDAVEACKSALSSGIVAGGATTLVFASSMRIEQGKKQVPALEPFVKQALQQPFRLLMSNAAEDGGYRLNQVLNAGYGKGFNLRDDLTPESEPIDLFKAGVVDATKVMVQVVKNAFSIAGSLLTSGAIVTEVEDEPTQAATQQTPQA
jgi:chaperonin GroEL